MTESEFMELDGYHAEWVKGVTYFMAPVTAEHDEIRNLVLTVLSLIVEEKDLGVVHGEPFGVKLYPGCMRSPDVMFISKRRVSLIRERYFEGGPDLVVEVTSVSTMAVDYRDKLADYEKAGVREYWILDPLAMTLELHRLRAGKMVRAEVKDGTVRSKVVPGFYFEEQWLRRPLPKKSALLRLMLK